MSAAEALVGGAEGRGDLAYDVHVLSADQGRARAGAEHAGGGLVVVAERHGDAGGGEGRDGEEAAPFDVGAAQVGDGEDGSDSACWSASPERRPISVWVIVRPARRDSASARY